MTDKERYELLTKISEAVSDALNPKIVVHPAVSPIEIVRLHGKKVMDVEEYLEDAFLGKYKAWRGSTEDAYFYIVVTRGVMTITFEEREMLIGQNLIVFGINRKLLEYSKKPNKAELIDRYNADEHEKDTIQTTFGDVMKCLNWTLHSSKVKVKQGQIFLD